MAETDADTVDRGGDGDGPPEPVAGTETQAGADSGSASRAGSGSARGMRLSPIALYSLGLVGLLLIAGLVALVAPGLLLRSVCRGTYKLECHNNLLQIYGMARAFAREHGAFPLADGESPRAHESLNLLVRSAHARYVEPILFKCPAGDARAAETDEAGRIELSEGTLDYAWTGRRLTPEEDPRLPLASDKHVESGEHGGHRDVLLVLWTDGSVAELDAGDLPGPDPLPEGLVR